MSQHDRESAAPAWLLGGWLIEGEIGRGGMGRVFRARHPRTRARAAIKVLLGDWSRRPDVVARFRQEAIAVNLINHPGIVRVFDSGESADGAAYIVMEYLEGLGLREWVGSVPVAERPRQIVRLGHQIASAMAAAHASRVVHRDLKPENILVVDDDLAPGGSRVKILDFGIAKVLWGGVPEVMELDDRAVPGPRNAPAELTESVSEAVVRASIARLSGAEEVDAGGGEALRVLPPVRPGVAPAPPLPPSLREGVAQPTMPFTQEGAWGLGTRSYMAPEQARHSGSVDARADVYSLGVILYELLEGRTPGDPDGAWPPPIRAAVSEELVALIHRVLSRDPDERPQMAAVVTALQRIGRAKRELDAALARWVQGNKAPKLLPRGKELHELAAWARDIEDLSSLERGFLDAAVRTEASRERAIRMLLGVGVALLIGMVATTTVFWLDAARARRSAEAAERGAWDHSRLEAAARAESQDALQKMTRAQKATEEALATADRASGDATRATDAREEMVKAKAAAEQAALRAKGAAQAANVAKDEAEARHQQTRSELERRIATLLDARARLAAELDQVGSELERARGGLRARDRELRTAELKLSNEAARAGFLRQQLDEVSGRLHELGTRYAACARRPRGTPSLGTPPPDDETAPFPEEAASAGAVADDSPPEAPVDDPPP